MDVETNKFYLETKLKNAKYIRIRVDREGLLKDPAPRDELDEPLLKMRYCRWCDRFTYHLRCPLCGKPTAPCEYYREETVFQHAT